MKVQVRLHVDAHSRICWPLTESLKRLIEGGGVPREQALPSIREPAAIRGINRNTVASAIGDLNPLRDHRRGANAWTRTETS